MVIWITGLPGAGKSTIATELYQSLIDQGKQAVLLDGDKLRDAFSNSNYDEASRLNLAMTYAKLGKMFSLQGQIAICATVSMFDAVRDWNRQNIANYYEVYLKVPENTLVQRNQKKLYSMGLSGQAKNVLGVNMDYQEPKTPNQTIINDGQLSPMQIIAMIKQDISL